MYFLTQAFSKCTADVDQTVTASIPHIPRCIAALKEDFGVVAEYSPETGRFLMEGSFEQIQCAQVRKLINLPINQIVS